MAELAQEPLLEPTDVVGIVGTRRLVCVQTLDIARLTPEPVALVPGFVAVSGRGSRNDSNESSKTNWLAAVALLLGDPEWSLHSSAGAQNTSALLFDPITAGVEGYPRADHGYIVGVFAYRGDATRAITVWCRVNDGSPYLKIRWRDGIALAEGETTLERHQHADEIWASLPGDSELGAQKFAEMLYGPAPRALAYVSTRGDRQSGASLLKMQAGGFRPAEIGDQLIALTGRQAAFEKEEHLRAELDLKQRKLEQRRHDDHERWEREEANLKSVRQRARAREQVMLASESWELHFARGFLDVLKSRAELERKLDELEQDAVNSLEVWTAAERGLNELAEPEELRQRHGEALDVKTSLEREFEDASTRGTEAKVSLQALSGRERELAAVADGWVDKRVSRYHEQFERSLATYEDVKDALAVAKNEVDLARRRHEQVMAGEGGRAGDLAKVLRTAGVDAQLLVDAVELDDDARDWWEPRLDPYREAIAVPSRDLAFALDRLSDAPGAMLIAGDEGELPDGVRQAPKTSARFLAGLAARTAMETDPTRVIDEDLGLVVVGGYLDPQTGRQARLDQAALALRKAVDSHSVLEAGAKTAAGAVELARSDLRRAEAACDLEALKTQRSGLESELETARLAAQAVRPRLEKARAEAAKIENQLENLESMRQLAHDRLRASRAARDESDRALADTKGDLERAGIDYWRNGWGRSEDEARAALGDEPLTVKRLRNKTAEEINRALNALEIDASGDGAPTRELADAARSRTAFVDADDDEPSGRQPVLYDAMIEPLRAHLAQYEERDAVYAEQIKLARDQRDAERATAEAECEQLQHGLEAIQDALEHRLEQALRQISEEFDRLNRQADGFGAALKIVPIRPQRAVELWQWEVTPQWRRSPSGSLLPYTNRTNSAQEKLSTVQLVLAALLAAPNPEGRVLILDELGDSLGENHRREAIRAIAETAHASGVTVLATCQDSVLEDAMDVADELLFFEYPRGEAYNRPTLMFGFSDDRQTVELTAERVREGRPWW